MSPTEKPAKKAKATKNLVPIGTHVPMETKMTIIALAESQNKSVYELLQEKITEIADEYGAELDALRKRAPDAGSDDNGEDLLK